MKSTNSFLALGDSYTVGESVTPDQSWPYQLAHQLRKTGFRIETPRIIARTGWRADDLKKAIKNSKLDPPYNYVSLLIGVNNQYQGKTVADYEVEFEELLNVAIAYSLSKRNVFVLSIPDYGYTPFGRDMQPNISREIDHFNQCNETITRASGVAYINITDISRRGLEHPELVATDGLHPSEKMYDLWVERILLNFEFQDLR